MKNLPKIVLALCVAALCAFVFVTAGCITPQDTQRAADAHQQFDTTREQTAAELATGAITAEEATKRMEAAIKALGDELKAIGSDVGDRSPFDWQSLVNMGLSALLGFGSTNIHRNMREKRVWGTPEAPKGT